MALLTYTLIMLYIKLNIVFYKKKPRFLTGAGNAIMQNEYRLRYSN